MSAAEKHKTPIPLLVNNSVASSGVRGWHLIMSRAAVIFCQTTSLVALIWPSPVPHYPRYLHVSSRFIAWRVSPLIVNDSGAGSCSVRFLSSSISNKYLLFTWICIPHQAIYICMYIYIYVYIITSICKYIYICIHICMYTKKDIVYTASMYVYIHTYIHMYIYTYIYMYISLSLYINNMCMCIYMYVYIPINIYVYIYHIYVYMYVYIYIRAYSSMYIHIYIYLNVYLIYICTFYNTQRCISQRWWNSHPTI